MFDMTNTHIILMLACTVAALYFLYRFWPKTNWLHAKNQRKAQKLLADLRQNNFPPEYIFGMLRKTNPFVFEELLLQAFAAHGFKVKHNKRYTGDGGIDGVVYDTKGDQYLIQAKRYKNAINPSHVAAFATLVKNQAVRGFFIHTGRTGQKSYANSSQQISIISGQRLLNLLQGKSFYVGADH